MKQVVTSTDLSSDFGLTSNNKLFNTNIIGASGTPNNTTVPPVIEKIWFWVDITQNQITHFWKPSTSTWISLKDFTERSINLNNVTPAFTPNDILQPTTTEVESWVNANLTGNDKVNGTLITWYIPTNYSFNSSAILELTNSGTTGFINSFKVNGVNILSNPIDISVTNYWLNLITIFDNYISGIGKTGTMADEGDPVSNYYFPINNLNFVCYLEIDYVFDSVTGTDTGNNILAIYPSIGDIKNPTHIWILDLEGIRKVSSETPFVKTGFNTSTSLIDVKQTDSLYRKGKLNLGESFANLPEDVNHYLQIVGNTFENGRLRTTKGFYSDTPNYSITVDVVNGDDNLNIMLYPNSSFKTITKALEFATKIVSNFIYIDVINTTPTNKATLSGFNLLFSRNIGIGNNAGIMQYVDFSGSFLFYNGTLNFTKLNVVCANNTAIQLFNSTLITNSTNITLSPNRLQGTIQLRMGSNMQLHDSAGSSIIFSANNQAVFDNYAGEINEFLIDGGASVINTGSFTGCKLFSGNHTNFSAIVKIEGGASLPTTLDLTNCIIYQKGNIYLPSTTAYIKVGNPAGGNNSNYAQSVGGKVGALANNQNWLGANGDLYLSANIDFDTFATPFSSVKIVNASKNVLIKKLTDSGLGDLQVPVISLGDNEWHYSEDGQQRFFFDTNGSTYARVPTNYNFRIRHGNKDTVFFYENGTVVTEDNLFDIVIQPKTVPLSGTVRSFTFRKESNNQDYRFFDWDGTTARDWWKVFTQTLRLQLGNLVNIIHGTNVGINTTTPNQYNILDVVSTDKGSRPFPSMTQAQRTALNAATPVGTHVYQTDGTEGVYVKKSGGWVFAY